MRMPRKWSHTGEVPLTPRMSKYLIAVPRTSGFIVTHFHEYDPPTAQSPAHDPAATTTPLHKSEESAADQGPFEHAPPTPKPCPTPNAPQPSSPTPKPCTTPNAAKEPSSDSEETARSDLTPNEEPTSPADAEQDSSEGLAAAAHAPSADVIMVDDCQADPAARPDGGSLEQSTPREILLMCKPICQQSGVSATATVHYPLAPPFSTSNPPDTHNADQDARHLLPRPCGRGCNLLRRAATWPTYQIGSNCCAFLAILFAAADFSLLYGLFLLLWLLLFSGSLLRIYHTLTSLNAGDFDLTCWQSSHLLSNFSYCKLTHCEWFRACFSRLLFLLCAPFLLLCHITLLSMMGMMR